MRNGAKIALIGMGIVMSGCVGPRVHRYIYPDFSVVVAPRNTINKECDSVKVWDDGTPRKPGSPIGGCWKPDTKTMWIPNDEAGCRAIIHELAHQQGYSATVANGIHWESYY